VAKGVRPLLPSHQGRAWYSMPMYSPSTAQPRSLKEIILAFKRPSVLIMLFLGYSAGLPIMLIFSSLSLWLGEAGVVKSQVTFFSWAALGYSFKFVWAPLVDRLPLPFLTKLMGRRRSWLLLSQFAVIASMLGMAFTDPASGDLSLKIMALAAVGLGFSSATQDIVIDAYRIECDSQDMQALLASTYSAGYRIAMIIAGAGALWIADSFGTTVENYRYSAWMWTYVIMAGLAGLGIITTFFISEPKSAPHSNEYQTKDFTRFFVFFLLIVSCFIATFYFSSEITKSIKGTLTGSIGKVLAVFLIESGRMICAIVIAFFFAKFILMTNFVNQQMVVDTYLDPVRDFFKRYGKSVAILLLCLVGFYRISDIVLGVISNVFYQDMGFTKTEIANVVKTFGVVMVLVGTFFGGILSVKYGVIRILFWGAVLSSGTNLLFMILAGAGKSMPIFYMVVAVDNLAAGVASAAFIAFLSSLTSISFTAVQYAIFSSLMTLFPKTHWGLFGDDCGNHWVGEIFPRNRNYWASCLVYCLAC